MTQNGGIILAVSHTTAVNVETTSVGSLPVSITWSDADLSIRLTGSKFNEMKKKKKKKKISFMRNLFESVICKILDTLFKILWEDVTAVVDQQKPG